MRPVKRIKRNGAVHPCIDISDNPGDRAAARRNAGLCKLLPGTGHVFIKHGPTLWPSTLALRKWHAEWTLSVHTSPPSLLFVKYADETYDNYVSLQSMIRLFLAFLSFTLVTLNVPSSISFPESTTEVLTREREGRSARIFCHSHLSLLYCYKLLRIDRLEQIHLFPNRLKRRRLREELESNFIFSKNWKEVRFVIEKFKMKPIAIKDRSIFNNANNNNYMEYIRLKKNRINIAIFTSNSVYLTCNEILFTLPSKLRHACYVQCLSNFITWTTRNYFEITSRQLMRECALL